MNTVRSSASEALGTSSTCHSGAHSATPSLPWSATATSSGRWFQSSAEPSPQSRPTKPVADLGSHGNGDRGLDDGHEVTADVDVVARIRRRAHGIGDEGAEEVLAHGAPFQGLRWWRRSCRHRSVQTASSSEPPTSVGLACRQVGAWRRQLVKLSSV